MKKKYIIKKNYYIHKIILEKKSVANKYFIVYKKHNNTIEHFRFVVSIGKKVGKAVIRNKIKRQIKSIIYEKKDEIIKNYDILIIVRPTINGLNYQEIEKQLHEILCKAKLIKE